MAVRLSHLDSSAARVVDVKSRGGGGGMEFEMESEIIMGLFVLFIGTWIYHS